MLLVSYVDEDHNMTDSLKLDGRVEVLGPQVPSGLSLIGGRTKSGIMIYCIMEMEVENDKTETQLNLEFIHSTHISF